MTDPLARVKDRLRLVRRSDGISRRKVLVIQFIHRYLVMTDTYPTLAQIAEAAGYEHAAGAREALRSLEKLGVVEFVAHGAWRLAGLSLAVSYQDSEAGRLLASLVEDGRDRG